MHVEVSLEEVGGTLLSYISRRVEGGHVEGIQRSVG